MHLTWQEDCHFQQQNKLVYFQRKGLLVTPEHQTGQMHFVYTPKRKSRKNIITKKRKKKKSMALVLIPEGGLHSSRWVTPHQCFTLSVIKIISLPVNHSSLTEMVHLAPQTSFYSQNFILVQHKHPNLNTTHEHSYKHFTGLIQVWHTGLCFILLERNIWNDLKWNVLKLNITKQETKSH